MPYRVTSLSRKKQEVILTYLTDGAVGRDVAEFDGWRTRRQIYQQCCPNTPVYHFGRWIEEMVRWGKIEERTQEDGTLLYRLALTRPRIIQEKPSIFSVD